MRIAGETTTISCLPCRRKHHSFPDNSRKYKPTVQRRPQYYQTTRFRWTNSSMKTGHVVDVTEYKTSNQNLPAPKWFSPEVRGYGAWAQTRPRSSRPRSSCTAATGLKTVFSTRATEPILDARDEKRPLESRGPPKRPVSVEKSRRPFDVRSRGNRFDGLGRETIIRRDALHARR